MKNKNALFFLCLFSLSFYACGEKEKEIIVESIAISQPSAELAIGETLSLKATVSPSNASYDGMTWTSTKTTVATVSNSGLVSALSEGNTTITVMAGGKSASCSVIVLKSAVAVTSISLSNESIKMIEGEQVTLTATVLPEDASNKTITWTSTKESIATVKDGVVTAILEGETLITAKAGDQTASCIVIVQKKIVPVESIELNKIDLTLFEGEFETLTAQIKPENATEKTLDWESSDTNIAVVDKNGTVTAIKEGETTITASAEGRVASCKLTVKRFIPVERIELNNMELALKAGETALLVATITPLTATNQSVKWESDATAIATVSSEGVVTAVSSGQAIITATTLDGGRMASCTVTVCLLGDGAQLGHEWVDLGLPSGLKWSVVNLGASSPEGSGDFYAWGETRPKTDYSWLSYLLCNGSDVSMNKYVNDNKYGAFIDNITELEDIDDAAHINWGGGWKMPNQLEFQELKDGCTWVSTTQAGVKGYIGTSRYNGKTIFFPAAGHMEGTYHKSAASTSYVYDYWTSTLRDIQASSAIKYSINMMVGPGPVERCYGYPIRPVTEGSAIVPVEGVGTDVESISLKIGEKRQLSANVIPSNATNKTVFWKSASSKIALVSSHGIVTAMDSGTTQISVSTADGGFVSTITVTVDGQREINGHEWVDLGLPSGLKWATCNIGATKPEAFGHYFAWGETSTKSEYKKSNYKWGTKTSSGTKLTKYCTVSYDGTTDGRTVLTENDDAAHVNWGGSWRMPTNDDVIELQKSCTWTWTTLNGVEGYQVTSKTNLNSVFFPASGFLNHDTSYISSGVGTQCALWTSSLCRNGSWLAYSIEHYNPSGSAGTHTRENGLAIRPVSE